MDMGISTTTNLTRHRQPGRADQIMEIATNAVLVAVLLNASQFVKSIDLPLPTPLERSNVVAFRIGIAWSQAESDLGCYLAYKGGYEFTLSHGGVDGFHTRDSFTDVQHPSELKSLVGEVRFSEAECFTKAKEVFQNLGYTNLALLNAAPQVTRPIRARAGTVPRFVFRWVPPDDPQMVEAQVEVNANKLTIEHLSLVNKAFWRKSWPITFGTTNTLQQALGKPSAPRALREDLEVRGLTRDYAIAYLQAALPEISDFCSKLGPPFPGQVSMQDFGGGVRGRLSAAACPSRSVSNPGI
jgi:hypothetical protein